MALSATIFKVALQVSDVDRAYYATHALTLARHPSETDERLMLRLLAFILHADDALQFGRGLCVDDEPDLERLAPDGERLEWIRVGLPDVRILRKACGKTRRAMLYVYGGSTAQRWWTQNREALQGFRRLGVCEVDAETSRALAARARRNMQCVATLQDGELWLAIDEGEALQVVPRVLQAAQEA